MSIVCLDIYFFDLFSFDILLHGNENHVYYLTPYDSIWEREIHWQESCSHVIHIYKACPYLNNELDQTICLIFMKYGFILNL